MITITCISPNAKQIPIDKQDDTIKIICNATKVREKAVAIVCEYLPHAVTKNISQKEAEEVWCKLTEIGAKASIKEFNQSNHWVVFRNSGFTTDD